MDESSTSTELSKSSLLNTFSLFNVQGLKPQTVQSSVPYISDLLKENNQLFMALTETWLHKHTNAEISIDGYTIFRSDRKRKKAKRGRYSGGTAIYIRNDIAPFFKVILEYSNGVNELLVVFSERENTIIAVMYRQTNDSVNGHPSTNTEFIEVVTELRNVLINFDDKAPDIFLCGDFNLPHVKWPEGISLTGISKDEKDMLITLNELMGDFHLNQCIEKTTHKDGNILDLLLTNNKQLIHSYSCFPTVNSISHHSIVQVSTHYCLSVGSKSSETRVPNNNFEHFNYHNESVDWNAVNEKLNLVDWTSEFKGIDPEAQLEKLMKICYELSDIHVPKRKPFVQSKTKRIPRQRRILMRKRRKIKKIFTKTKNTYQIKKLKEKLVNIEVLLQRSYKETQQEEETRAVNAIKTNSKYFFSYAKKHSKTKTKVGPLLDKSNSEFTSDSKLMADILQNQYKSVFSLPKPSPVVYNNDFSENDIEITDIMFSVNDIIEAINSISLNSAPGPDGFSAIFLKQCKESLAAPLDILWKNCLNEGVTPQLMKTSYVSPIYKGGDQGDPVNYRPVALTSHLVKIFEKIVRKNIVNFLENHNLFNKSQHGFRGGRSFLSQLLSQFDTILTYLERGVNLDSIYLDFSKAFDKVDHDIVMAKLSKLGIKGKLLKWINSFLTQRVQVVTVNGIKSEQTWVLSGVPQGSVLGPLLFLLMIGDIDNDIKYSFISSFADDTRLLKDINELMDTFKLQSDLNVIYKWTADNNMKLNGCKFEQLSYGKNCELKEDSVYLNNKAEKIEKKPIVKDLGVFMSDDCSFTSHIQKLVIKTKDLSSWILRTFKSREKNVLLILWKSLVIPHLDYCSQLWSPTKRGLVQELEMVQRTFIRKINEIRGFSYWEQLNKLKIYSLERRRERYMIIYTWSILEDIVPNFSHIENETETGGIKSYQHIRHGRKCVVRVINRGTYQNIINGSLSVQGPRLFNCLPRYLRNLTKCSKVAFKRELDKFLQTVPDEPLIPNYVALRRAESNSIVDMNGIGLNELDG